MSRQVQLLIDLSDRLSSLYQSMAERSRAVCIVDQSTDAAAVVTDNVAAAVRALEAGKHVLVLEPFAISAADRDTLESSNRTVPALPRRFRPSIRRVKEALDAGKLGDQGLLRIHCWQPDSGDLLQRELDVAVWLLGQTPSEIYACRRPGYIQAHLGFGDGAMALIDIDTTVTETNSYDSLSLIGSTGAAYADDHRNIHLLLNRHGTSALAASQENVALAKMIDAFANEILDGRSHESTWQQVNTALRLADQVRAAADQGQVIAGVDRG